MDLNLCGKKNENNMIVDNGCPIVIKNRQVHLDNFVSGPQIPNVVLGKLLFFGLGIFEVSRSNQVPYLFEQCLALVFLSLNFDFAQTSVGIEWDGGMEEQVRVGHCVHASVAEDLADEIGRAHV